jgi:hypothetical protein
MMQALWVLLQGRGGELGVLSSPNQPKPDIQLVAPARLLASAGNV